MTAVYENLFATMKNNFTVVKNNREYSLGGYLSEKAPEKVKKASLSLVVREKSAAVAREVAHNIEKKLAVTKAPSPEKTLTAFPLRTSLTALCAALVICLSISPVARFLGDAKDENAQINSFAVSAEPTNLIENELFSSVNV